MNTPRLDAARRTMAMLREQEARRAHLREYAKVLRAIADDLDRFGHTSGQVDALRSLRHASDIEPPAWVWFGIVRQDIEPDALAHRLRRAAIRFDAGRAW